MGIEITCDDIILTDGDYTFEDIFLEASQHEEVMVKTGDSMYYIARNIRIGQPGQPPATLSDTDKCIHITGELLQIYKGSELRLGIKHENGSTSNGCFITMPEVDIEYGFGYGHNDVVEDRDPENAGNVFFYNSTINISGFWAFFSGPDQHVEIIDCNVDGFGRIEGANSILRNITFSKSHYRFGILAPKGRIKEYNNVRVGQTSKGTGIGAAVYFNPTYAPQMTIEGGVFAGYEHLVYTEPHNTNQLPNFIEFIDSDIRDGIKRATLSAFTSMYIKYTYNPVCKTSGGKLLSGVKITIRNRAGDVVYNGESDINGEINTQLIDYEHTGEETDTPIPHNPHKVYIDYESDHEHIKGEFKLFANRTMKKVPFWIYGGENQEACDVCNCVKEKQNEDFNILSINNNNLITSKVDHKLFVLGRPEDEFDISIMNKLTDKKFFPYSNSLLYLEHDLFEVNINLTVGKYLFRVERIRDGTVKYMSLEVRDAAPIMDTNHMEIMAKIETIDSKLWNMLGALSDKIEISTSTVESEYSSMTI